MTDHEATAAAALGGALPGDMFARALKRGGDRPCVSHQGRTLTYADVDIASNRLARALAARGVGVGDGVGVYLRNCPEAIVADMAIFKLGAVRTPMNEMLAAPDIAYILAHSGAKALVAHSSFAEVLDAAEEELAAVTARIGVEDAGPRSGFDAYEAALAEQPGGDLARPDVGPDDRFFIGYTGGTTGRSKGVVQKLGPIAVNLLAHVMAAEIRADDHLLLQSPLAHSAGFFAYTAILMNARITLAPFEPGDALRRIEEEGITWTFGVPTMIYRLLDHPDIDARDLSSIRTIFYGAAPIASARLVQGIARFGPVFKQLYGQTEAPNFLTTLEKHDHLVEAYHRSCGQPTPLTEVRICDEAGAPLPKGEVGEICVKAPFTLAEYHNDPEKTAEAYREGWLLTGDVGWQAETGHVFLVDRAKDMIISGGMNVYSTEVEDVVQTHPSVSQVAVIGLPDDDWGEAVTAFVVPAEGAEFDAEAVLAHAKAGLAKYKAPKRVIPIEAIPVTAFGKPDKKALRADYWGGKDRAIN